MHWMWKSTKQLGNILFWININMHSAKNLV